MPRLALHSPEAFCDSCFQEFSPADLTDFDADGNRYCAECSGEEPCPRCERLSGCVCEPAERRAFEELS